MQASMDGHQINERQSFQYKLQCHCMSSSQRLVLDHDIEVELKDGSIWRIRPGPYGKGLSIIPGPSPGEGSGQRGRKPRPGTIKLRARLEKDSQKGQLRDAAHYVKWMLKQDPDVGLATARQIVYRERRSALERHAR